MRIFNKDEVKIQKDRIVDEIKQGAVFIYPTDTIYGLGCNALDEKAVKKLRLIKKRCEKPFSIIVPSREWISQNCHVDKRAEEWIKKLPGPYTLILKLKNKKAIASSTNMGLSTVGIRIPNHWCATAVALTNVPIVTTSANITGGEFMTSLDNLDPNINSNVDFIIYEGEKKGRPSKIIDLTKEKEEVIVR